MMGGGFGTWTVGGAKGGRVAGRGTVAGAVFLCKTLGGDIGKVGKVGKVGNGGRVGGL